MEQRALYYTCQLCTEQLHTGDDYSKTAPVYGLNLLCFDLYEDSRYYRSFILKDEETNKTYRQNFKIAFFELRKAVNELSKTKEVETLNIYYLPETAKVFFVAIKKDGSELKGELDVNAMPEYPEVVKKTAAKKAPAKKAPAKAVAAKEAKPVVKKATTAKKTTKK